MNKTGIHRTLQKDNKWWASIVLDHGEIWGHAETEEAAIVEVRKVVASLISEAKGTLDPVDAWLELNRV